MGNEPNHNAADEVDKGDDQRHDGVALHKLGSTVHCAEEICLALNFAAAQPGGLLIDQAGTQIRVNGHLLTGHGIERKPGRNLCHAL
ncbi:hypothetical protein SDC9_147853 [bioreactor metagenome]|uniref:Uncharacterized protein n=1 Tax=bioreactor metagenome TaxID=1076179 RepID=A0A645EFY1_9ZZZZ